MYWPHTPWRAIVFPVLAIGAAVLAGCAGTPTAARLSPPAVPDGAIAIQVASAQDDDPFAAGKVAAELLRSRMGAVPPHAIVMAECFEEETRKRAALDGVASIFPRERIFGCATYGSFDRERCFDLNSITLMGIGGDGIAVGTAFAPRLGIAGLTMEDDLELLEERLHSAGEDLAGRLPKTPKDRLIIVMADAHSPKNQFLVEGMQKATGGLFPITGGSANKNAGQTFLYYAGRAHKDAALALILSGGFQVGLSGRQAKSNDAVISSAGEAVGEAMQKLDAEPFAAIAFNCAGRKGKLDRIEDELDSIVRATGAELPLFGCYCAGEIGPADTAEAKPGTLSSGVGWHVMFTVLGRK